MDHNDPAKLKKCRSLLKNLQNNTQCVISTQVIQEFYVTATKELGADHVLVKNIIINLTHLETICITINIIKDAIDYSILNKLSFRDALIVSAANSAKCSQIWTEDLHPGQIINGIEIINPLLEIDS